MTYILRTIYIYTAALILGLLCAFAAIIVLLYAVYWLIETHAQIVGLY